jgi:hypothetical protein
MNKFIGVLALLAWASVTQAQLQGSGTQFWHQGSAGIGIAPETGADFASVLASGDFNCDNRDDVAIGMPGEDLTGASNGGRVLVLYSAPSGAGLASTDRQIWAQSGPAVSGDPAANERFGRALASGDFDDDGCGDLAIGVADEIDGSAGAGAVHVLYGAANGGLNADDNDDYWHQGVNGIAAAVEAGDGFGAALAVGDFDDDGIADLAIGVPGENIGTGVDEVADAGAIHVLFGGLSGLSTAQSVTLFRGNGLNGSPQAMEHLGEVLASGNVNGLIAGDEVVIGIPDHSISAELAQAGAVMLISDVDGQVFNALITQDSPDVPGVAEVGDSFGGALAVGDFDADGIDEVAVGAVGEDVQNPDALAVGSVNILDFDGDAMQLWLQDDLAPEQSEEFDNFGTALAAADFNDDGVDDLAIGTPGENLGPVANAGLIHVLYGDAGSGLTDADAQVWLQTLDPSDTGDHFGEALATGSINSGGGADLIIGAPDNSVSVPQTGSASVLYSLPDEMFANGFELAL